MLRLHSSKYHEQPNRTWQPFCRLLFLWGAKVGKSSTPDVEKYFAYLKMCCGMAVLCDYQRVCVCARPVLTNR